MGVPCFEYQVSNGVGFFEVHNSLHLPVSLRKQWYNMVNNQIQGIGPHPQRSIGSAVEHMIS